MQRVVFVSCAIVPLHSFHAVSSGNTQMMMDELKSCGKQQRGMHPLCRHPGRAGKLVALALRSSNKALGAALCVCADRAAQRLQLVSAMHA